MKKLLLITLLSSAISLVNAQVSQTPIYQQYLQQKRGFQKQQSTNVARLLPQKTAQLNAAKNKNEFNIDNMPVYGNSPLQLTFLENNNNGLDIYRSSTDNMYIVKPDSTFYSGMSTGNFKTIEPELKVRPWSWIWRCYDRKTTLR